MTKRMSSRVVRPIGVAIALICGGLFTSTDAPRAQTAADPASPDLDGPQPPAIESTTPAAEATGVSGRNPLIVQFTKHMAEASLTSRSITLVGPAGAEPVHVVPLEQGRLVFVWPDRELLPASRYTLFVQGATDAARRPLPLGAIGFDTAAKPVGSAALAAADRSADPAQAAIDVDAQLRRLGPAEQQAVQQASRGRDPEDWQPGPEHLHGRWRADRDPSPLQALPSLQAPAGTTALSGRVLGMDGRAVPGVTLRIEDREVRSDVTGRFLLPGVQPGFAKLEIEGETANRPDAHYGYYAARVELEAQKTTVLPYVIWMPRLDPAGTVHIPAPTTTETIVRSPRIPGLELHIPAGTVIRDRQGKIVTELNMTAIPVDRPPFPVPDLGVPVYFTVQPGGAVLQSATGKPAPGARLFYPNFKHEVPGARGVFWNYDAEERGWFVYGLGTINGDASQAIPDDGVVIHELTGAMFDGTNAPPPDGPPPCDCGGSAGDPVNLVTGQFDHTESDLVLPDVVPINVARSYSSTDKNQRAFGVGMTHLYDVFLFSQNQYQEVDLILPNGTRVHYVRTSPGNDFPSAVFQSSAPGPWQGSVIRWNLLRAGWDVSFRDGRKWFFFQFQPVSEMTDANGNLTRIVRQNSGISGKVAQIISPNGRTVSFTYNAAGLVGALTDNLGRQVSYSYDGGGRLLQVVDPTGGHRDYTWDTANNRITAIHDANGNLVVQNEYGTDGRVFRQLRADLSSFRYGYVTQNGVTTQALVTDPRGTTRSVFFDLAGYMVENVFPMDITDQQVTRYENSNGRLTARIDALNRRTEYQYDAAGNVTRMTRLAGTPQAVSTSVTYDPAFNLPRTITDPNGNTTTLGYDGAGNLIRITDALGHSTTFTPDGQGRPSSISDPLGRVTSFGYAGADLSTVTDALGRQRQRVTDAVGRLIATVDRLGHHSVYEWDDLNRLQRITDPLGGVTRFSYDGNGNLLDQTDASGHTTSYTYDSQNRMDRDQDALLQARSVAYEAGGLPSQITDRSGQISALTYDALGRLKTVSFGATAAHPTAYRSRIENSWDAGNRLIQIVDTTCDDPINSPGCARAGATRVITRTYDDLDRETSEVTPQGEVDYTYDAGGRRTSMTIKNGPPGAQVAQPAITYSYDAANHLTGIHQTAATINASVAQHIAFAYDAAGQRTQTTLANGSTVNYSYDAAGQVTAIVYRTAGGATIGDLQYEYDAAGHRTSMGGSLAQLSLPAAEITDATYDADNRLLTWGGKSLAYDANGGLVNDGSNTYQWDERKRLVGISDGTHQSASFEYDSRNRRTGKTVGGVTTGFLYDGINAVQELQGTTSAANVTAHLLTTDAIDETVLRIEGNDGANLRSVLSDANGNTLMLLDAAQAKVTGYAYDPYGVTQAEVTTGNTQQYAGRENDGTGLYYYRSRYYMPGIARFISEDPIGWSSGQTNNYAYVAGDPISFLDPTGLGFLQHLTDFSAGFGDALSFGLTRWIRKKMGVDSAVDPCSGWYTAGDVAGMVVGAVATAGIGGEARAAEETVDLFRAVGVKEFEDIMANQAFRLGQGSMEVKQFALAFEDALAFADIDLGAVAIIKATVPKALVEAFEFSRNIDVMIFKNGVITVREELLPMLNDALIAIEHVL